MWRLCNNFLRVSCPCAAAMVAIFGVKPVFGNVADSPPAFSFQITNVMQLRQLADSNQMFVATLRLEGAVWWSCDQEGWVILQDATGVARLELDLPCRLPRQGERLSLQGACTVVKTTDAIKLASIPVVENDGIHAATEQSGRIVLNAGMHPIRVDWFNRTGLYELGAFYEGPNLPRQKIPNSALFR